MCTAGRLAANILRNVPDGHVDRIRCPAAKDRQLRLVRGNDDGDDSRPRTAAFKLFLFG